MTITTMTWKAFSGLPLWAQFQVAIWVSIWIACTAMFTMRLTVDEDGQVFVFNGWL